MRRMVFCLFVLVCFVVCANADMGVGTESIQSLQESLPVQNILATVPYGLDVVGWAENIRPLLFLLLSDCAGEYELSDNNVFKYKFFNFFSRSEIQYINTITANLKMIIKLADYSVITLGWEIS
ncbi:MAG: hypothetical protein ABIH39_01605 [Candidatus Margulisiibacteriota bacterium]